jgi:RNA-directed DNA polymerase
MSLQEVQLDATVPVIVDRVHQARVANALEPEWEARFEPRSYGFRPGRGCHDAIEAVFHVVKGKSPKRLWVLDADLAGAFDRIAHDHLMLMLGSFPARGMIQRWLKAGVIENGKFAPTEEGTPQGGVMTAPTQSRTSSSSGRFPGRRGGVGHEAWYSSV